MILKKTVLEGGGQKTDSSAILGKYFCVFIDIIIIDIKTSFM